MPSVILGGLCASDPAGSRAVRDAVLQGLPNHDLLDFAAFPDVASVLGAARRSAAVISAGTRLTPVRSSAGRAALVSGLARRPLALLGVTSGPIHGPMAGRAARWAVHRADLLLLADEGSAAHLAAAGAPTPMRVSADPAWLVLHPAASPPLRGENVAVVLDGRVLRAVEGALAAALVTVAGAGRPVRLVPWGGPGSADAAMASRLARAIGESVRGAVMVEPAPATLADAASLVADAHAVVALRYRAVHAAAAAGVPVVAVAGDPRLEALAGRLGQPVLSPLALSSRLPIALERITPASVPSPAVVEDEIGRARAGLGLVRLVVEPEAVGAADVDHLPLVPVPWL